MNANRLHRGPMYAERIEGPFNQMVVIYSINNFGWRILPKMEISESKEIRFMIENREPIHPVMGDFIIKFYPHLLKNVGE